MVWCFGLTRSTPLHRSVQSFTRFYINNDTETLLISSYQHAFYIIPCKTWQALKWTLKHVENTPLTNRSSLVWLLLYIFIHSLKCTCDMFILCCRLCESSSHRSRWRRWRWWWCKRMMWTLLFCCWAPARVIAITRLGTILSHSLSRVLWKSEPLPCAHIQSPTLSLQCFGLPLNAGNRQAHLEGGDVVKISWIFKGIFPKAISCSEPQLCADVNRTRVLSEC